MVCEWLQEGFPRAEGGSWVLPCRWLGAGLGGFLQRAHTSPADMALGLGLCFQLQSPRGEVF